jgi:hypothetical protein
MTGKTTGWHRLPITLQRKVLEYRLVFERPTTHERHDIIVRLALLSWALVSKQLHLLATRIYYKCNTFAMHPHHPERPRRQLPMAFSSPAVGLLVRKLEICVELSLWRSSQSLHAMLAGRSCYLNRPLIPDEPQPHSSPNRTAWQGNFPNVGRDKAQDGGLSQLRCQGPPADPLRLTGQGPHGSESRESRDHC